MGVPAGVTQKEGHTGFLHVPSAVLASIFLARRIQPSPPLVKYGFRKHIITVVYIEPLNTVVYGRKLLKKLHENTNSIGVPQKETRNYQLQRVNGKKRQMASSVRCSCRAPHHEEETDDCTLYFVISTMAILRRDV